MAWTKHPLESLCKEFTDGNWVESKDQSPEGIRLIQTGNVGEGIFKDRGDKARYISASTFSKLKCFEIFEGDCLISRLPDPVGRSCVLPNTGERMITAVDCTVVRFDSNKLLPSYFNYYSQSSTYLSDVDSLTSGATRKRISRKNLGKVEIPTPPIPEQKRIVAILDQAFADIDKARALTEQNLKNAREVFESYLQQVFSQRGEGWEGLSLADCCITTQGVQIPKSQQINKARDGYKRYLYISDFDHDKNLKFIKDEHFKKVVSPDDLVVANTGASAGTIFKGIDGILSNNLFKVSFDTEAINRDFLYYFVTSKIFKDHQRAILKGAANPHMGHENFKSTPFSYPVRSVQDEIVKMVKELECHIHRLEQIYFTKLCSLDELKKSLLQKAFSGELTKDKQEAA
jgi:type I restriction enzyme S subunit